MKETAEDKQAGELMDVLFVLVVTCPNFHTWNSANKSADTPEYEWDSLVCVCVWGGRIAARKTHSSCAPPMVCTASILSPGQAEPWSLDTVWWSRQMLYLMPSPPYFGGQCIWLWRPIHNYPSSPAQSCGAPSSSLNLPCPIFRYIHLIWWLSSEC